MAYYNRRGGRGANPQPIETNERERQRELEYKQHRQLEVGRNSYRVQAVPQACHLCFQVQDFSASMQLSAIRENIHACNGCNLLSKVLTRAQEELPRPGRIAAVRVLTANSEQQFATFQLSLDGSDDLFDIVLGVKPSDRENAENDRNHSVGPERPRRPWFVNLFGTFFGENNNANFDNDAPAPNLGYLSNSLQKYPVQAVKDWVAECSTSHPNCHRPALAPLPRRVIDVGHQGAFLYESRGVMQPYITLSHCWEDSEPPKTTRSNLTTHLGRLVWNDLSPVIQEAVDFTRALGVRYLWIDSLCVLQDDAEEWAVEAQRMAGIYEDAYLTLMFHQDAPRKPVLPDIISSFSIDNLNAHLRRKYGVGWNLEKGHPSERGWCFQERLLSSRIVHCLPSGYYFECCQPANIDPPKRRCCSSDEPHSHHMSGLKTMFSGTSISPQDWRKLVTLYSQKRLTFSRDLLPALSGIANRVRDAGRYYGGTWEKTMVDDLLWTTIACSTTRAYWEPERVSGPSFIWSSTIGDKCFISVEKSFRQALELTRINLKPRDTDALGELSGYVNVRAQAFDAQFCNILAPPMQTSFLVRQCDCQYKSFWATLRCTRAPPGYHRTETYIFCADWSFESMDRPLVCIPLFGSTQGDDEFYSLVLADFDGEYRRIGISGNIPRYAFYGAPRDIRIW